MREYIGRFLIGFPISMLSLAMYKEEYGPIAAIVITMIYLALLNIGIVMICEKRNTRNNGQ